jgi:RNA polymerase sigma-70 factor (ECF subfamily)
MVRRGADGPVVARAKEGDEAAWRELYLLHARRLVVWLGSAPTGDAAAAAEDIAAEAWVVAATRIREFHGTEDDFGGWLVGIARKVAANHRRRVLRRRTDATDDVGDGASRRVDSPEVEVGGQDLTRRLLARLSPREAEVIACIDVVGLDVAATARALGMSTTAVRVARHRGLGRLRRILDDETDAVT